MVFTFISFGLTTSFLIIKLKPVTGVSFLLAKLGEISYSVYLLHPIVFNMLQKYGHISGRTTLLLSGVCSTLFVSVIVYYFYEKKFMHLGQIIITRLKSPESAPVQINR
jgi:exopolysaccharide production protein ExoZ